MKKIKLLAILSFLMFFSGSLWAKSVTFWVDTPVVGNINIYYNDKYVGKITSYYREKPKFGSAGCIAIDIIGNGKQEWKAISDTGIEWAKRVFEFSGDSTMIRLYASDDKSKTMSISTANDSKVNPNFWGSSIPPPPTIWAKANISLKDGMLYISENVSETGLYFKFGSVIGNDGYNIVYNPTNQTFESWSLIPYTISDKISHTIIGVQNGIGDPCRLVGLTKSDIEAGKVDNLTWRTPTPAEYGELVSTYNEGSWEPRLKGTTFGYRFFPASGHRHYLSGAIFNFMIIGNYWSSDSYRNTWAKNLTFSSTYVSANNSNHRAYGFSVRCVRNHNVPPVTVDIIY